MCRHLAYLGPPLRLGTILIDPEHSLFTQSWAPRRQTHGVVNADGFGVGWFVDDLTEPARHRSDRPIWADETFTDLARVIWSHGVLAAVRSTTVGLDPGVRAVAPFRWRQWLFSHNGALSGWPEQPRSAPVGIAPGHLSGLEALTDSAWLWMLLQERLERSTDACRAVADLVRQVSATHSGDLNLLLTDGQQIVASRFGASLVWRRLGAGTVVASEPFDDSAQWQEIPDRHLVCVRAGEVSLTPL